MPWPTGTASASDGRRRDVGRPGRVERHVRRAGEVGASGNEILGSAMLTYPGVGLLRAVEAIPPARLGFDVGRNPERDLEEERR